MSEQPAFSRRNLELLWNDVRLVVLDTETLWESGTALPESVETETRAAIEAVRAGSAPVRLTPATKRVRFLEHKLIETAGLTSASEGDGEERAVEVRPGSGVAVAETGTETDRHEGRYRVIEIALVEVKRGKIRRTIHRYANPGVPIDPKTFEVHQIRPDQLAGAPAFPRIAPEILERLLPGEHETVVLVAHNAPFDLGVLETEFALMDRTLPDLPVLDTMGPIIGQVGLAHDGASLDALLAHLGLANAGKHSALGDATATAEAAIAIVQAAAEHGFGSIIELLDAAGNKRSANAAPPARIRDRDRHRVEIIIPASHIGTHKVLRTKPTKAQIATFVAMASACGAARCPDLGDGYESLVRACSAPPEITLRALLDALDARCRANDGAGANTIIGAINALYEQHCPMPASRDFSGTHPLRRRETIAAYHRATEAIEGLVECSRVRSCPACAEGRPCSRYELVRALAPGVLDPKWDKGRLPRETITTAWLRDDETAGWFYHGLDASSSGATSARGGPPAGPLLADAATAALLLHYSSRGDDGERVAQARQQLARVLALGCADPSLIELDVECLAAPGRLADLDAAIAQCDAALANRPTHGDSAWTSLAATRDLLAGRRDRLCDRKRITKDGEIVIEKPHHPGANAH